MSIADISIWTAILAGALSFLSPCVLPLVPPYLCYMAGISVDQFRGGEGEAAARHAARRIWRLPSASRSALPPSSWRSGQGHPSIGLLLRQHIDILSRIGGVIIIIMGLHFLGVFRIGLLAARGAFPGRRQAGDAVGRLHHGPCLRLRLDALHRPGARHHPRRCRRARHGHGRRHAAGRLFAGTCDPVLDRRRLLRCLHELPVALPSPSRPGGEADGRAS